MRLPACGAGLERGDPLGLQDGCREGSSEMLHPPPQGPCNEVPLSETGSGQEAREGSQGQDYSRVDSEGSGAADLGLGRSPVSLPELRCVRLCLLLRFAWCIVAAQLMIERMNVDRLPLDGCVTWGKLLDVSEPQFPHPTDVA